MKIAPISQILISYDFLDAIKDLSNAIDSNSQILLFTKQKELIDNILSIRQENSKIFKNISLVSLKEDSKNFLLADANEVISKAYLNSENKIFLIVSSRINFSG